MTPPCSVLTRECFRVTRPLRPLRGLGRVAVGASCCAPWRGACILRPLPCREAATTGAISEGRTSVLNRRKGDYDAGKDSLPYLIRRRRRSTPQPLRGEALLYCPLKAPLPGELDAPQAQTEGSSCPATQYLPGRFCGGVKTPPYKLPQTAFAVFHLPVAPHLALFTKKSP